jgi:hypothetical protein
MHLDLTDEEAAALTNITGSDRCPFPDRIGTLRANLSTRREVDSADR